MSFLNHKKEIFILSLATILLLQGCETTIFGVDEDVWKTLSPAEREIVISGYNERRRIYQEQEPTRQTIHAMSSLTDALKKQNDIKMKKIEQKANPLPQHIVHHVHPPAQNNPTIPKTAPSFLNGIPPIPSMPSLP